MVLFRMYTLDVSPGTRLRSLVSSVLFALCVYARTVCTRSEVAACVFMCEELLSTISSCVGDLRDDFHDEYNTPAFETFCESLQRLLSASVIAVELRSYAQRVRRAQGSCRQVSAYRSRMLVRAYLALPDTAWRNAVGMHVRALRAQLLVR